MTVIIILSGRTSVLIFQEILNIHLYYHGFQISIRREAWPNTSGTILTILEALRLHNKRDGYLGGGFPHTENTWEFRIPH